MFRSNLSPPQCLRREVSWVNVSHANCSWSFSEGITEEKTRELINVSIFSQKTSVHMLCTFECKRDIIFRTEAICTHVSFRHCEQGAGGGATSL